MKIVGLCGGSGSGKGLVCSFFEQMGIPCIDTDRVYHELVSTRTPCLQELSLAFGEEIVTDNSLNRAALSKIVFSSRDSLELLNRIAHKHILNEVRLIISRLEKEGAPGVVVDAPLLFESRFNNECDVTVCVIADVEQRIRRIIERDSIDEQKARARIANQISDDELSDRCDYIIENNGNVQELESKILSLAKNIFEI